MTNELKELAHMIKHATYGDVALTTHGGRYRLGAAYGADGRHDFHGDKELCTANNAKEAAAMLKGYIAGAAI